MKKFKLFTTIASLCLAVALMAFGVYAATTSADITIGGNISFDAVGLTGTWSWEATGSSNVVIDEGHTTGTDSDKAVNFAVKDENEATLTLVVTFTNTSDVAGVLKAEKVDTTSSTVTVDAGATAAFTVKTGSKNAATITVTIKFTAANENTNETAQYAVKFIAEKTAA